MAMMRWHVGERDRLRAELAFRVRVHRLHDVADERPVLRPVRARSPAPRRSTRRRRRRRPRSPRSCSGRSSSCSRRSTAPSSPAARNAWPIENSTALPRPPPASTTVSPGSISVGAPVGPISTTGSPGFSVAHRSDEPPISSTIVDTSPRSRSTQAPVSARPSIVSRVPARDGGARLVVLQPVELAGREAARGGGRADDDLDDGRRQALDPLDGRAEVAVEPAEERGVAVGARPGARARASATTTG